MSQKVVNIILAETNIFEYSCVTSKFNKYILHKKKLDRISTIN